MNLFLVQLSPSGRANEGHAADVLDDLLAELPFLGGAARSAWLAPSRRCALVTASHPSSQLGGVRHVVHRSTRAATFAGRPVRWVGDFDADGRAPLDPASYLSPASAWADSLDGRWAAVRYDDVHGELEVASDPLGSYPLYVVETPDLWISNSPEAIRRLAHAETSRQSSLVEFFACGASLDGVPRWEGMARLPAGVQRFSARDGARRGPDAIDWGPVLAERFDAETAARRLVAVVRALADWPGRPTVVSLSGGRDSRVVLAAALAAGIDVRARTMAIPGVPGYPESADVVLSRALCARGGVAHEVIEPRLRVEPAAIAPALAHLSPGTLSLELAAQAVLARRVPAPPEPLELVLTGQCGELARAYYGVADDVDAVVDRLVARTMPSVPRPLLTDAGRAAYRFAVADWAQRQLDAGNPPSALLDLFYVDQRMPGWIAVSHATSEPIHDLVNPLASRRLIPQGLGCAAADRVRERFHRELVGALAPELLDVPFDLGRGRARTVAKARRELRRSLVGMPGADVLPEIAGLVRRASPPHGDRLWEVLDRRRVERLLARRTRTLDRRSRSLLWRLATILLIPDGQARTSRAVSAAIVGQSSERASVAAATPRLRASPPRAARSSAARSDSALPGA